jgi:hypothetical protein
MGCYVSGLYLEGAAWDHQAGKLKRQPPRQTVDELPVLQVRITEGELRAGGGEGVELIGSIGHANSAAGAASILSAVSGPSVYMMFDMMHATADFWAFCHCCLLGHVTGSMPRGGDCP